MDRSEGYRQKLPAAVLLICMAGLAQPGLSQNEDSAFLACADISDRGQRIACLEDALEAAAGTGRQVGEEERRAPAPDQTADRQRLDSYGRETARVETNGAGEEALLDKVSDLGQPRPNQWRIKLSSGQVWRQVHPRRYNLREGDEVRIYPTQWGDNFRLETEGLSGFIQVLRVE